MAVDIESFDESEFQRILTLVRRYTGIHMDGGKRQLLSGRLNKRLRQLQLTSFSEYCDLLESTNSAEAQPFINAVTTNLTSFYRESHHFEYLSNEVMPAWLARNPQRRLRIWSAGCSTGPEPYSIAITVAEALKQRPDVDWKILATDLDSNVLDTARAGIYENEQVESISMDLRKRYFETGSGESEGHVRVCNELRNRIMFKQLNLMENWPINGPLDIIFCRNVAIYFDKPTQARLFSRFADLLDKQGTLFIGHSETLNDAAASLEHRGHTTYEKVA